MNHGDDDDAAAAADDDEEEEEEDDDDGCGNNDGSVDDGNTSSHNQAHKCFNRTTSLHNQVISALAELPDQDISGST